MPWPGTADSAIASTIFGSYGFATEVETTPSGPDPDAFTPIQRATDLTFLRSLAAKWGFSAYLEADGDKVVGHFHLIDPLAAPAATLRLGFGGDADQVGGRRRTRRRRCGPRRPHPRAVRRGRKRRG